MLWQILSAVSERLYTSLVSWPGELWQKHATGRDGVVHAAACALLYINQGRRPDNPKNFNDCKAEVTAFVDRWWPTDNEEDQQRNNNRNNHKKQLVVYAR